MTDYIKDYYTAMFTDSTGEGKCFLVLESIEKE